MKILLTIPQMNSTMGGAERVFADICNGLHEAGHDLHIVTFDTNLGEPFYELPNCKKTNLLGQSKSRNAPRINWRRYAKGIARRLPSSYILDAVLWKTVYQSLQKKAETTLRADKYDACISFLPPAFTVWQNACLNTNTPHILSTHNIPERDFEDTSRWDKNRFARQERWKAVKNAQAIIVLQEDFKNFFVDRGIEPDRLAVIPNMVDIPQFEIGIKREKTIIAAGRFEPIKRYDLLIDYWANVANELPDWTLKIFGDGSEKKNLEQQVERLELSSSVHIFAPSKSILEEMRCASVFAHPSLFEGFGMSVAESMSVGLPVIAMRDSTGLNHLIHEGQTGLFIGDELDFKQRLKSICLNDGLREMLGSCASEVIKNKCSKRTVMKLWELQLSRLHKVREDLKCKRLSNVSPYGTNLVI